MNSVQKTRTDNGPQKVELCRRGLVFRKAWGTANEGNVTLRMAASKSPFSQGRYSVEVDVVGTKDRHPGSVLEPVGLLREGPVEPTHRITASNFTTRDENGRLVQRTEANGSLPHVLSTLMKYPEARGMIGVVKDVSKLIKDPVKTV